MKIVEAARTGNVKDLRAAIAAGEDVNARDENGQKVLSTVAKCRPDLVRLLLEHGADVNLADTGLTTPLHWAVEFDNDECIRLLLAHGADTRARDGLGEVPLHWAAWTGHVKAAQLLLEFDPKSDIPNGGGFIPLDLAMRQEHEAFVRLLKLHAADAGKH